MSINPRMLARCLAERSVNPSMNATPIVMTDARTMWFNMANTVVPPHRRFLAKGAMTGRVSPRRRLPESEELGPMNVKKVCGSNGIESFMDGYNWILFEVCRRRGVERPQSLRRLSPNC